ncbi:MAG: hypothetical protein ACYS5V_06975 [Planctomycetota bacterium]|jgi:hypothetical protein
MKRLTWIMCVVAGVSPLAMGGAPQVDLSNSQWDLDAKLTATAQKLGKVKSSGPATIAFGGADFTLTGPDGDAVTGTFAAGNKAVVTLTPGNASLTDYVTRKVEDALASKGITGTVKDVTVTPPGKAMVKPTVNKKGTKLSLTVKIKARVTVTVQDGGQPEDVTAKVNVTLTGKAFKEAPAVAEDGAGTKWSFSSKIKATLQGLGTAKETGDFDMTLGPDPADNVPAGAYKVSSEDGGVFTGTYVVGKNGKMTFDQDLQQFKAMLEEFVKEQIEEGGDSVSRVSVEITSLTITGKLKPGKSLKLTVKTKALVSATVNGVDFSDRKATYNQNGMGTPMTN